MLPKIATNVSNNHRDPRSVSIVKQLPTLEKHLGIQFDVLWPSVSVPLGARPRQGPVPAAEPISTGGYWKVHTDRCKEMLAPPGVVHRAVKGLVRVNCQGLKLFLGPPRLGICDTGAATTMVLGLVFKVGLCATLW